MFKPTSYKFEFIRHKTGNFKGLWQLNRLAQDGVTVTEEIVDADSLSRNIGEISKFFELLGY